MPYAYNKLTASRLLLIMFDALRRAQYGRGEPRQTRRQSTQSPGEGKPDAKYAFGVPPFNPHATISPLFNVLLFLLYTHM